VERQGLKRIQVRTADLAKIEGTRDFSCPNRRVTISPEDRRVTISPEDETESVHSVLETKVRNVSLKELTIVSTECESNVSLVGFISIGR